MTEKGFLGVIGNADDIKIIGLCGRSGSGKDFIAKHFLQPLGYVPVALANGFKHKVIGMGNSIHDVFVEKPPDVRKMLQEEGTERGRDLYGKDIWVRTLESYISHRYMVEKNKKFVITDVRFKNEMEWLKSVGGTLCFIDSNRGTLTDAMALHPSETEMMTVPRDYFDQIFNNEKNVEMDHLHRQIDTFCEKFGMF